MSTTEQLIELLKELPELLPVGDPLLAEAREAIRELEAGR